MPKHFDPRSALPDDPNEDDAEKNGTITVNRGQAANSDNELLRGAELRRGELLQFIAGIIARSISSGGKRPLVAPFHAEEKA